MHFFHVRLMLSDQPKFQNKLSLFTSTKKGYWLRAVLPKKSNRIFHYFPINSRFVVCKCRQFSVLGVTRGSLGSFGLIGIGGPSAKNWGGYCT
jgi:hypothetical protein